MQSDALRRVIAQGVEALLQRQRADGVFDFCCEVNPLPDAMMALCLRLMGTLAHHPAQTNPGAQADAATSSVRTPDTPRLIRWPTRSAGGSNPSRTRTDRGAGGGASASCTAPGPPFRAWRPPGCRGRTPSCAVQPPGCAAFSTPTGGFGESCRRSFGDEKVSYPEFSPPLSLEM
ncbi:hypothetical protein [Alicyclobacillus macrosporangiidus]|uniref:Uncharacterized protein n=1 Tax=Alicyclobacillus macrosporangiidus TaxID=392015 RepID=A0A1I7F7M1_9BACL|nr:hypothetical protein SAMN05421543_101101 [Alicyclobacillus macrosporangiidus]